MNPSADPVPMRRLARLGLVTGLCFLAVYALAFNALAALAAITELTDNITEEGRRERG